MDHAVTVCLARLGLGGRRLGLCRVGLGGRRLGLCRRGRVGLCRRGRVGLCRRGGGAKQAGNRGAFLNVVGVKGDLHCHSPVWVAITPH